MKLHRLTAQLIVGAILTLPAWVHAAGLGKLTVRSALGQPLSAEIELLVADKAELDSLNASLASGQSFKDAQIEYAPVLSTLQFSIGKGAGGKPVLKLTSSKPVNDPFMDMLIELNWASGRLLREYTILLDPPGVAVPQTVSPVAVSVPQAEPQPQPEKAPAQVAAKPVAPVQNAVSAAPLGEKRAEPAQPEAAAQPESKPAAMESYVRVKSGDSLGKIAQRVRPANISLEQALVSLYHENPDAFQNNNMNLLKSGKRLKVPSVETMAGVDLQSARSEINLQAADWQAYRAKLAERVSEQPAQEKEAPSKTVTGKITPKVEDKAQPKAESSQDVLKLSKAPTPVVPAKPDQAAAQKAAQEKALAEQKARAEQEDRIAREKAAKESAERAAALEKQIQDMQKLAQMKEQAAAPAAPAAAGAEKPAPVPAPKVSKAPPPVEEPQASWSDELLQNPIYWIGGLAIVVLGGVLWWMVAGGRMRRKQSAEGSTDSLITGGELNSSGSSVGVATGGVVNTGDTSFLTDFSQAGLAEIDTHDVDPIAEADVYMAYGRDAQAEEILKEALKKSPDRHEIRLKLLEIYAARKNVTEFESVAGELYAALGGQPGSAWDKAVEMGRGIDPHNPLYGGSPEPTGKTAAEEAAPFAETVELKPSKPEVAEALGDESGKTGSVLEFATEAPDVDTDLKLDLALPEPEIKASAPDTSADDQSQALDFDLSGFDLKIPENTSTTSTPQAPAMDFSGLDLDLGDTAAEEEFDEVATKLDLAKAYLEMGDKEGAREILQEVISEGSEKQKNDAQGIMASL